MRSIERELDLLRGAIAMVADHATPTVTLVGLDFGPAVLAASEANARQQGVVLEPLWRPENTGCDIRVSSQEPWGDRG